MPLWVIDFGLVVLNGSCECDSGVPSSEPVMFCGSAKTVLSEAKRIVERIKGLNI